jgi:hypothetical protein
LDGPERHVVNTLHITNGDGAADLIRASGVAGDVLPWRDPMHHGSFPANSSIEDLQKIRAAHLAGYGLDASVIERDFKVRDKMLALSSRYDRVLLWFEHDLLDQLQMLQILDRMSGMDFGDTALELICIGSFPEIELFRGLGELNPAQIASLFDQRIVISPDMLTLAEQGWRAFCSDTPLELAAFIETDLSALPFLRDALLRHFEEYPQLHTGLTRTEAQLLTLISRGVQAPNQLFLQNMDMETALFIGNWHTYWVLDMLQIADLIETGGPKRAVNLTDRAAREAFLGQSFALTDKGMRVLSGEIEPSGAMQRDQWLGGVHIKSGAPLWFWDAKKRRPVLV